MTAVRDRLRGARLMIGRAEAESTSRWPTGRAAGLALHAVLAAIAFAVVFASSPGQYVVDFRFEVAWNPGKTFARLLEARDIEGGLGRADGAERSLLPTLFFLAARGLGAAAWVAQRLWHGSLLFLAAAGMVSLLRSFRPRLGVEHLVAGVVFMLGPVALGLLLPSPIFAVHAVAPWMVVATRWGLTGERPLRWAAVMALCLALIAPIELPGTVFNLVWVGLTAVVIVATRRSDLSRSSVVWGVSAVLLSFASTAYAVVRTLNARDSLALRLDITESFETPARTSSFSESARGLGHWLTYFGLGSSPREQLHPYIESPWVIVATFVVLALALWTALRRPRGERLVLLVVLIPVATLAMVGVHPVGASVPYGDVVGWFFERVPATQAFRNTSKAGPGLAVAVCALFGIGCAELVRRRSSRDVRAAGLAVVGIVVVLACLPAFSGNLYNRNGGLSEIPRYWYEAAEALDALDDDATVLILPGTSNTTYRWGPVGDDVLAALTDRRWVVANGYATSAPVTNDFLLAIDQALNRRLNAASSLAPALARAGVDHVLVRNDLDWRALGVARPADLQTLRADPAFELIGEFGDVGEQTVAPVAVAGEDLNARLYESRLSPLELFSVEAAQYEPAVQATTVVVDGAGAGVVGLSQTGLVGPDVPTRYVQELDDDALAAALGDEALALVTDTNLWQVRRVLGGVLQIGPPASPEDDGSALFENDGSVVVPFNRERATIGSTTATDAVTRPEHAFDGNAQTVWLTETLSDWRFESITVDWPAPVALNEITVETLVIGQGEVLEVGIEVNGEQTITASVDDDGAVFAVNRSDVESLRFFFNDARRDGLARFGFVDIDLGDRDLRSGLRAPTSFIERAASSQTVDEALGEASLGYLFTRVADRDRMVEAELFREFDVDRRRTFEISGTMAIVGEPFADCRGLLVIDGQRVEVRGAEFADEDLGLVQFEACEAVTLSSGTHRLSHDPLVLIESVTLLDDRNRTDGAATPPSTPQIEVTKRSAATVGLRVENAAAGSIVRSGEAFQPGWSATIDGEDAPVFAADTLASVRVPTEGPHLVQFTYGPQTRHRAMLIVTAIGLAVAMLLLVSPRRRERLQVMKPAPDPRRPKTFELPPRPTSRRARMIGPTVVFAFGWLAAGIFGVAAAAIGLAVTKGRAASWVLPALVVAGVATSTVFTLWGGPLEATSNFALQRPEAGETMALTLCLVAAGSLRGFDRAVDEAADRRAGETQEFSE